MAFTMHSHSGQFCPGHAVDELEDIIERAISLGFKTMGLSEHMPRYEERDLYPEELGNPQESLDAMIPRHDAYLAEARRLRAKCASQIHILIGFEAEFIRSSFTPLVLDLARSPDVDYFIGSVHHVHGVPIDYDDAQFARAVAAAGGSEQRLYEDYYDLQYEMLTSLKPRVVGHFDLIRLKSEDPGRDVRKWKAVWEKVMRNLRLVKDQGGWLECNTAALRKGLAEPYPCREISEAWLEMGGEFTMSDDSHGITQVGTNYARGLSYLESLGVKNLWTFERPSSSDDANCTREKLIDKAVPMETFMEHFKS